MSQRQPCRVIDFPEEAMAKVTKKNRLEEKLKAIFEQYEQQYHAHCTAREGGLQVVEKDSTVQRLGDKTREG